MSKNQYKSREKQPLLLKSMKNATIIGVDEAGRGAWAGPAVAACVLWQGKNPIRWILRDSKKMSPKEREKTYEEILLLVHKWKLIYGIGIIDNAIIDTLGIREANRLAMQEALNQIQNTKYKRQKQDLFLFIDGRDNYSFDIIDLPKPEYIVRGDSKIQQIMAASIVAKVTRDRLMIDLENTFPWYGFARHKGYGTQTHQSALQKIGITKIHRKSYKPIKLATSGKGL
jgi:ribonuclease HII